MCFKPKLKMKITGSTFFATVIIKVEFKKSTRIYRMVLRLALHDSAKYIQIYFGMLFSFFKVMPIFYFVVVLWFKNLIMTHDKVS